MLDQSMARNSPVKISAGNVRRSSYQMANYYRSLRNSLVKLVGNELINIDVDNI
jgi:hypothetical protein